jgi:hypothetical protein
MCWCDENCEAPSYCSELQQNFTTGVNIQRVQHQQTSLLCLGYVSENQQRGSSTAVTSSHAAGQRRAEPILLLESLKTLSVHEVPT